MEAPIEITAGQIFNVGSNKLNFQIKDVGRKIMEIIPDVELDMKDEIDDPRNYHVNFNKIYKRLGFDCEKSVEDGIIEIKEFIESDLTTEIDDYHFSNVKYLSRLKKEKDQQIRDRDTGLYNLEWFNYYFKSNRDLFKGYNEFLSIIMIRLDSDTPHHSIISGIADRISNTLRKGDYLVLSHTSELFFMIKNQTPDTLKARLTGMMENLDNYLKNTMTENYRLLSGIITTKSRNFESPEELLSLARAAMEEKRGEIN